MGRMRALIGCLLPGKVFKASRVRVAARKDGAGMSGDSRCRRLRASKSESIVNNQEADTTKNVRNKWLSRPMMCWLWTLDKSRPV